jgi:hypothetical protein
MDEKIICRAIVEVVGKPKEYVAKAIQTIIESAKEIKGLKIQKTDVEEVKSLKDEKLSKTEQKIQEKAGELFSTFAEIEFSAKDFDVVFSFCFDFLPSSIEIIEPEHIEIKSLEVTKMLTDFLSKMHNADMAVKRLNFENSALRNNSRLLLRNMIMVSLKLKEKNLGDLSKAVGIPQDQLKPFLESLIEDKFIVKEEDIYKLN